MLDKQDNDVTYNAYKCIRCDQILTIDEVNYNGKCIEKHCKANA